MSLGLEEPEYSELQIKKFKGESYPELASMLLSVHQSEFLLFLLKFLLVELSDKMSHPKKLIPEVKDEPNSKNYKAKLLVQGD